MKIIAKVAKFHTDSVDSFLGILENMEGVRQGLIMSPTPSI